MEVRTEVVLVILALDIHNPAGNKVVLTGNTLPKDELHDKLYLLELASRLLKIITNLDAKINGVGWVNLVQSTPIEKFTDKYRKIYFPFACLIPEEIELTSKDDKWMPLIDIFKDNLLTEEAVIIQHALSSGVI